MKVDIDILDELEREIADQIHPAEAVYDSRAGKFFLWNLSAGTLSANMKLANGAYGVKQVAAPKLATELETAIHLAFEFVKFIQKEGKRQVPPHDKDSVVPPSK